MRPSSGSIRSLLLLAALVGAGAHATQPPLLSDPGEASATSPRKPLEGRHCVSSTDCPPDTECVAERCQTAPSKACTSRSGAGCVERPPKYRGTVPDGYRLVTQTRWGLVAGGIGVFAAGYGLALAVGLSANRYGGVVPILGPFFQAAEFWLPPGQPGGLEPLANFLFVLLSAVEFVWQVAGVALVSVGFATPSRRLERADAAPQVTLLPGGAGSPLGASLIGRF